MSKHQLAGFVSIVAVLAGTSFHARQGAGQTPEPPRRVSPGQAAEAVGRIAGDVAEARRLAARVGDRDLANQIDLLLNRAETRARDLRRDLDVAARTGISAISPADFDKFLASLKGNPFDEQKVTFIENFAKGHRFTCQQATVLLRTFSFDDGKVKAAVALHPQLVDPGNFYRVLDCFSFDTGRQAVRKSLGMK